MSPVVAGVIVLSLIVITVLAYFYAASLQSQISALNDRLNRENQRDLYACLNAYIDGDKVKFPATVPLYIRQGNEISVVEANEIYVSDLQRWGGVWVGRVCYLYLEGGRLKAVVYS